jgi:hypothetical protein
VLAGGPQRDGVLAEVADHGVGLHRVLVDGGEHVVALHLDLRLRAGPLDAAGVEPVAVADVAGLLLELAETVEQPGPQGALVEPGRAVGERLLEGADHGELVVLDHDRPQRRLGLGLGLGRHRGHRLAGEADAVERQERAVLERVPVVGVDAVQVGAGQDAGDPGQRLRLGGIDAHDARVGDVRAEHLAVQHPRHLHVAGERGLAAHLRAGIAPVDRAPDLGEELVDGGAHGPAARSRAAARIDW